MEQILFPKIDIGMIFFLLMLFLVVGLGMLFLMLRKKGSLRKVYPIQVEIIEERHGNKVIDFDFARRVEETEQGTVIELKKRKKKIPPIPLSFLILDKRGKSHLKLYTPDNERFFPIKITSSGEENPEFLEEKSWDIVDYRTGLKLKELFKTETFIEKYGNILFFIMFAFLTLIGMYFVFGKLGDVVSATSNLVEVTNKNVEMLKSIIQSLGEKGVLNVTGPTPPPY
ncbi:MAG: hypothetical protein QW228_05990 [Candidatus Aenigmatarchaeota archaeon]